MNLTSLNNFPHLKNLTFLSISGNQIENGLENLNKSTSLKSLILSDNNIVIFEELEKLKLDKLENLYKGKRIIYLLTLLMHGI